MTRPLRIMVVEDNDAVRQAICDVLAREGHDVVSVVMAEDVDDEPTGFLVDLYIIDVNLPGESGISLAARLRQSHPDVGIVIVSARTSVEDRVGGYQSGANIYLTKPVSLEELRAVVAGFGERAGIQEKGGETSLTISSLRLLAIGPSGESRLTQTDVVLLSAFARAPQQTLEHWQVAQHLAHGGQISKENLEVKLGRLRKKLLRCGLKPPAIQSIRGIGYKLCDRARVVSE